MRKKTLLRTCVSFLVLFAVMISPLRAAQPDEPCDTLCREPARDKAFVIIDANTGQIIEGSRKWPEGTRLQVIFVNKNPFKYDYSFTLKSTATAASIITNFLNLIPGLSGAGAVIGLDPPPSPPGMIASMSRATAILGCAGDDQTVVTGFRDRVLNLISQSTNVRNALQQKANRLNQAKESLKSFLDDTNIDPNGRTQAERFAYCTRICKRANDLLTLLKETNLDDVTKLVNDFQADVTALERNVLLSALSQPCKDELLTLIGGLKDLASARQAELEKLSDQVKEVKPQFDKAAENIKKALGSALSFSEQTYPEILDEATTISIQITRKNIREENPKAETINAPPLQVGDPPISLSAGFGFSTIDEVKFVRQIGADGKNHFGRELNSNFKATAVVLLNAHIRRIQRFNSTFAVSVGLGFTNRDDTTSYEFIVGPSLGFLNNRFFITAGYSAARVPRLAGGFNEGDLVPDNLADPLPTQKNFQSGAMFAFTYRFK